MSQNFRIVKEFIESRHLELMNEKVREALHYKRIIKLSSDEVVIWVFYGKERDYLIVPKIYCSCMDFELNVIFRGVKKSCYHIITQHIAESNGFFRDLRVSSELINDILVEILYIGRSPTLRKILT
jgi:predicted nucleic acid-binding Zn finger protein